MIDITTDLSGSGPAPADAPDSTPAATRADPAAGADADTQTARNRGRGAHYPWQIPLLGWRDVLLRVYHESHADNLTLIAAGMAFYAMLSVAPALAFIISLYGLLVSPEQLQAQMLVLSSYLPGDAQVLVQDQLAELVTTQTRNLGWSLGVSATISLWSASRAMKSLFMGLNAVYDEIETRPWIIVMGQSLLFTLIGIVVLLLVISTMAILPALLAYLPLNEAGEVLFHTSSFLIVSGVVLGGLAVLYRFGPSRTRPRWRWVAVGALVAWLAWGLASAGLSWYVGNFDSYQRTYGALGAVAILLMWFFVSAYAVLIGGELNAELEHQTEIDSTVGEARPMGERGALMADTVGHVPSWRRTGT
ncbi:MAG: YihY/virulence factor BrkB family protein [Pseudomonadota bacterium]